MTVSCLAVVFPEPRTVSLEPVALPDPTANDLVVKTLYSGISAGTEGWSLTGQYWSTRYPMIPGYQKIGVVERTGSRVRGYAEGDLVYLRFTRVDQPIHVEWGGHTSRSVIAADEAELFQLPEGIDRIAAAQLCVAAVSYHGVCEVMPVQAGERIAVIGQGPIGLSASQYAAVRGAKVYALDLVPERLELAVQIAGVEPVWGGTEEMSKLFKKEQLDAIIDTSAHVSTINTSFHWLRAGGRYCFQGYYPGLTSFDLLWPHAKELVFYNPTNCTVQGQRQVAKDIAEGRLKVREAISHVVPARDAPAIYQRLLDRDPRVISAVLDWQEVD